MSLKTDIEKWFGGVNKWPGDLDAPGEVDCVQIGDKIVDKARWFTLHEAVYLRKTIAGRNPLTFSDEYVMVSYLAPATEMQDWEDFSAPDVFEVEPVLINITEFRKVTHDQEVQ